MSSGVLLFPDTEEATGSSPVGPTRVFRFAWTAGEPIGEPICEIVALSSRSFAPAGSVEQLQLAFGRIVRLPML